MPPHQRFIYFFLSEDYSAITDYYGLQSGFFVVVVFFVCFFSRWRVVMCCCCGAGMVRWEGPGQAAGYTDFQNKPVPELVFAAAGVELLRLFAALYSIASSHYN